MLNDLQMKYRDTLDGVSVKDYLYSNSSKLAVIKGFREETFGLIGKYPPKEIKNAPLVHL